MLIERKKKKRPNKKRKRRESPLSLQMREVGHPTSSPSIHYTPPPFTSPLHCHLSSSRCRPVLSFVALALTFVDFRLSAIPLCVVVRHPSGAMVTWRCCCPFVVIVVRSELLLLSSAPPSPPVSSCSQAGWWCCAGVVEIGVSRWGQRLDIIITKGT